MLNMSSSFGGICFNVCDVLFCDDVQGCGSVVETEPDNVVGHKHVYICPCSQRQNVETLTVLSRKPVLQDLPVNIREGPIYVKDAFESFVKLNPIDGVVGKHPYFVRKHGIAYSTMPLLCHVVEKPVMWRFMRPLFLNSNELKNYVQDVFGDVKGRAENEIRMPNIEDENESILKVVLEQFKDVLSDYRGKKTPTWYTITKVIYKFVSVARYLVIIFKCQGGYKHMLWVDVMTTIKDIINLLLDLREARAETNAAEAITYASVVANQIREEFTSEVLGRAGADTTQALVAKYAKYLGTLVVMACVYASAGSGAKTGEAFKTFVGMYTGAKTLAQDAMGIINDIFNDIMDPNSALVDAHSKIGEDILTKILTLETSDARFMFFDPSFETQCEAVIEEGNNFVNKQYTQTVKSAIELLRSRVSAAIARIQELQMTVRKERDDINRAVTIPVELSGPAGVGKSRFGTWLAMKVADALGIKTGIYGFSTETITHFLPTYKGEWCARVDEVNNSTEGSNLFKKMFNSMSSSDICRFEGAALGDKNAKWRGGLVIYTTNETRIQWESVVGRESAKGCESRLAQTRFIIEDPLFDGNRYGGNTHRKTDFSHLKVSRKMPVNPSSNNLDEMAAYVERPYTVNEIYHQLVHMCALQIVDNIETRLPRLSGGDLTALQQTEKRVLEAQLEKFKTVARDHAPVSTAITKVGGMVFADYSQNDVVGRSDDELHSQTPQKIRFEGPPGSGKTRAALKTVEILKDMFKMDFLKLTSLKDFRTLPVEKPHGTIYLVDDTNFEVTYEGLTAFLSWSNHLKTRDILFVCSNNNLPTRNIRPLWNRFRAIKVVDPAIIFDGTDSESRACVTTGAWRRMGSPWPITAGNGWVNEEHFISYYLMTAGYEIRNDKNEIRTVAQLVDEIVKKRYQHLNHCKKLVIEKDALPSAVGDWDLEIQVRKELEFLELMSTVHGVATFYASRKPEVGTFKCTKQFEKEMEGRSAASMWKSPTKTESGFTMDDFRRYAEDCLSRVRSERPNIRMRIEAPDFIAELYDGVLHIVNTELNKTNGIAVYKDDFLWVNDYRVTPDDLFAIHMCQQEDIPEQLFSADALKQLKAMATEIYDKNINSYYCAPMKRYKEGVEFKKNKSWNMVKMWLNTPLGKCCMAITGVIVVGAAIGLIYKLLSSSPSMTDAEGRATVGDASDNEMNERRQEMEFDRKGRMMWRKGVVSQDEYDKMNHWNRAQYWKVNGQWEHHQLASQRGALMTPKLVTEQEYWRVHSSLTRAAGKDYADNFMVNYVIGTPEDTDGKALSMKSVINKDQALEDALIKLDANMATIYDGNTGKVLSYGLIINSSMLVTVWHSNMYHLQGAEAVYINSDGRECRTTLYPDHDLTPRRRDVFIYRGDFPGMDSIAKMFISGEELDTTFIEHPVKATDVELGRLVSRPGRSQLIDVQLGYLRDHFKSIVHQYEGDKRIAKDGDCGLPLLMPFQGTYKVTGILCASGTGRGPIYFAPVVKQDLGLKVQEPVTKGRSLEDPTDDGDEEEFYDAEEAQTGIDFALQNASIPVREEDIAFMDIPVPFNRYSQEEQDVASSGALPLLFAEKLFPERVQDVKVLKKSTLNVIHHVKDLEKTTKPRQKRSHLVPEPNYWDFIVGKDKMLEAAPAPIGGDGMADEHKVPEMNTAFGFRPAVMQVYKYAQKVEPSVNDEIAEIAQTIVSDALIAQLPGGKKLRILGLDKGINGCESLPPLVTKTSCGTISGRVFGATNKAAFIQTNVGGREDRLWFANNPKGTWCRNAVTSIMFAWRRGINIFGVVTDCEKTELLAKEDVAKGKVRIFNIYEIPYTIAFRMVFGAFNGFLIHNHRKFPSKIGFNPDVHGMDIVHPDMKYPGDPDFEVFCFDIKRMDKNMIARCTETFGRIVASCYDEGDRKIIEGAIYTLVNTIHIFMGDVYFTERGNTSGNPVTTELNCVVAWFIMAYCLLKHLKKTRDVRYFQITSWSDIKKICWAAVYGDDGVFTIRKASLPDFGKQDLIDGFKDFGFDLDMFDDFSMVGRNLVMIDNHWMMPFKKPAIVKMMSWITNTDIVNLYVTINTALRQAALYQDEEFFNKVRCAGRYLCSVRGRDPAWISDASMRTTVATMINEVDQMALSHAMGENRSEIFTNAFVTPEELAEQLEIKRTILASFVKSGSIDMSGRDAFSILAEYCCKHRRELTTDFVEQTCPNSWECTLTLQGNVARGEGRTKQEAKKVAAFNWLQTFGILIDSYLKGANSGVRGVLPTGSCVSGDTEPRASSSSARLPGDGVTGRGRKLKPKQPSKPTEVRISFTDFCESACKSCQQYGRWLEDSGSSSRYRAPSLALSVIRGETECHCPHCSRSDAPVDDRNWRVEEDLQSADRKRLELMNFLPDEEVKGMSNRKVRSTLFKILNILPKIRSPQPGTSTDPKTPGPSIEEKVNQIPDVKSEDVCGPYESQAEMEPMEVDEEIPTTVVHNSTPVLECDPKEMKVIYDELDSKPRACKHEPMEVDEEIPTTVVYNSHPVEECSQEDMAVFRDYLKSQERTPSEANMVSNPNLQLDTSGLTDIILTKRFGSMGFDDVEGRADRISTKPGVASEIVSMNTTRTPMVQTDKPTIVEGPSEMLEVQPRPVPGSAPSSIAATGLHDNLFTQAYSSFNPNGPGTIPIPKGAISGYVLAVIRYSDNKWLSAACKALLYGHMDCVGDILYKLAMVSNVTVQGQICITRMTRERLRHLTGGFDDPKTVEVDKMWSCPTQAVSLGQSDFTTCLYMKRTVSDGKAAPLALKTEDFYKGDFDQDVVIIWVRYPPFAVNAPDADITAYLSVTSRFASVADHMQNPAIQPFEIRGWLLTASPRPSADVHDLEGRSLANVFTHLRGRKLLLQTDGRQTWAYKAHYNSLPQDISKLGGLIPSGLNDKAEQRFQMIHFDRNWSSTTARAFLTLSNAPVALIKELIQSKSFDALFTTDGKTPEQILDADTIYDETGVMIIQSYTNTNQLVLPGSGNNTLDYQKLVYIHHSDGTVVTMMMMLITIKDLKDLAVGLPLGTDLIFNQFLGQREVKDPMAFATLPANTLPVIMTSYPNTSCAGTNIGPTSILDRAITDVFDEQCGGQPLTFELYDPRTTTTRASLVYDPRFSSLSLSPADNVSAYMSSPDDMMNCVFRNVATSTQALPIVPTSMAEWADRTVRTGTIALKTMKQLPAIVYGRAAAIAEMAVEGAEAAEAEGAASAAEGAEGAMSRWGTSMGSSWRSGNRARDVERWLDLHDPANTAYQVSEPAALRSAGEPDDIVNPRDVHDPKGNMFHDPAAWGAMINPMLDVGDVNSTHNMTPYSAISPSNYAPMDVSGRGNAISAGINAANAGADRRAQVDMHGQDIDYATSQSDLNREFQKERDEAQYEHDSALSNQNYNQEQGLSKQGFDQNTALNRQTGNINLRNNLVGTLTGTAGGLVNTAADTAAQAYLANQKRRNDIKEMNAEQQLKGVSTGALLQSAQ